MISREEVEGLARLARIELQEAEIAPLQKDISDILSYMSQLSSHDITLGGEKVAPEHRNVMREDVPREAGDALFGKEAALRAAFPRGEQDYNVVRKIIQKDA